jgi:hypothetical protein
MTPGARTSIFLAAAGFFALTAAGARAGDPAALPPPFGQPVDAAELDSQRGMALPDCASGCTLGNMNATLTGNTSTSGAFTASNVIGNGSLANSAGAFVAVQNIGNNVIIQTNMAVDVNFVP